MNYPIMEKSASILISFALIFGISIQNTIAANTECFTNIGGDVYDISYFLKNNYQSTTKKSLFHSCPIDAAGGFLAEFGKNYLERLSHYKVIDGKGILPDTTAPRLVITAPTQEARYEFTSETGEFYFVGAISDNVDPSPSLIIEYQGREYTDFQTLIAPEGLSLIQITAKDISGNFEKKTISIYREATLDTTAPEIFVSYPSTNTVQVKSNVDFLQIIGSVIDNIDKNPIITSRYKKNNISVLTQGFPTVELINDITVVEIHAEDNAGNISTKFITIQKGNNNKQNIIDSDRDGLSDETESAIGTNPYKNDSDNDGYTDREEIINFYNPQGSGALFLDVSDTQEQAALISLVEKGALKITNRSFDSLSEIKRVEALKILTEAFPTTESLSNIRFNDVSTSHWFYNIIQRSVAQGLVKKDQENFYPSNSLKRSEALKMIFASAQLPIPNTAPSSSFFNDVNTQEWFAPLAQIAAINKLIPSSWGNKFEAGKNITRGEFAQISHKTSNLLQEENFVSYEQTSQYLETDESSLQRARMDAQTEDQTRKAKQEEQIALKQTQTQQIIVEAQNKARQLLGMPISLPTITTTISSGSSSSSSSSASNSSSSTTVSTTTNQESLTETASTAAQEEAARLAAENEAQRIAQEMAQSAAAEASRIAQEEAARMAQEASDMSAVDAARIAAAQETARIAAEQEAAQKAAYQAAQRAAQEEAARLAAEQEARRAAEENARIAAEEAARKAAEDTARRRAEEAAKQASQTPVTNTSAS